MPQRPLYLAAYDVSCPKRLAQALRVLKGYACGGQKSVFECYLAAPERAELLDEVTEVIDPTDDRFLLLPLAVGRPLITLGVAVAPEDAEFFYVG